MTQCINLGPPYVIVFVCNIAVFGGMISFGQGVQYCIEHHVSQGSYIGAAAIGYRYTYMK